MIVFERRAATILFNLLRSHPVKGPFLLPANICPIVPMVFYKARRQFEFIDIAPETLCMDRDALAERWSKPHNRPAGLIYVRTYGAIFDASHDFANIKSLSPRALIVDDRCLCSPDFSGTLAPYADVALYSTGYAKYVDIGYGGFGVVSDGIPYARTESAFDGRDLELMAGQYKKAQRTQAHYTYTDSDWLDTAMPEEKWTAYRHRVEQEFIRISEMKKITNSIYSAKLPPEVQFPGSFQSWRFNIQVREKEKVLDAIRREGLFASGHYDSLAGLFGVGTAPFAKIVHRHVINLFNDRYFSPEQAIKLTDVLTKFKPLTPGPLFA